MKDQGDRVKLDDGTEIDIKALSDITAEQWAEVAALACKAYDRGAFAKHQGKCWVYAFIQFLEYANVAVVLEHDNDEPQQKRFLN